MDNANLLSITDPKAQIKALELQHNREMAELEVRRIEAENERIRLQIQEKGVGVDTRELERKQRLLNRYNELMREFVESCQKSSWHESEIEDYLDRCEALKVKIEEYCKLRYIKPETLQIYVNLGKMIKQMKDAYNSIGFLSSRHEFNLCDKSKKRWEDTKLESFDTAVIVLGEEPEEEIED